jgi:hypothetical protein
MLPLLGPWQEGGTGGDRQKRRKKKKKGDRWRG